MFTDPLTNEDLYWIGYIQADGGMVSIIGQEYGPGLYRKRGGRLVFGQIHREPVEALLYHVQGNGTVRQKNMSTKYGDCIMYEMASSKPYYNLLELGVKKEIRSDVYKSKHFWRGLLDGDGSVGWVKNRDILYPVIAWCGSKFDMDRCADFIENLGLKRPKVGAARSIFRVAINGEPAAYLSKLLYKNEFSALDVKRFRAEETMLWRVRHYKMSRLTIDQQAFLYGE